MKKLLFYFVILNCSFDQSCSQFMVSESFEQCDTGDQLPSTSCPWRTFGDFCHVTNESPTAAPYQMTSGRLSVGMTFHGAQSLRIMAGSRIGSFAGSVVPNYIFQGLTAGNILPGDTVYFSYRERLCDSCSIAYGVCMFSLAYDQAPYTHLPDFTQYQPDTSKTWVLRRGSIVARPGNQPSGFIFGTPIGFGGPSSLLAESLNSVDSAIYYLDSLCVSLDPNDCGGIVGMDDIQQAIRREKEIGRFRIDGKPAENDCGLILVRFNTGRVEKRFVTCR